MAKIWHRSRLTRVDGIFFIFPLAIGASVSAGPGQTPSWTQLLVVGPPPPASGSAVGLYSGTDHKPTVSKGHKASNGNSCFLDGGANESPAERPNLA